jgi:Fe-S-cluster containining protein
MEISLDLPFIRGILAQERELALDEIRTLGVLRALENSQQRHDSRIASAPDVSTLACCAGCTWCCYFTVDVRAVEVFRILDFVEQSFTAEEKARVYAEVRANSATLESLGESERMTRNVKCPFLNGGRCTIYAARPQSCRNYHATNVAGCQQSYEEPGNLDIDPDFAPWVYQAGGAHVEAFSSAMSDAGYDVSAYELNCALDAALSEPGARERFEARMQPFTRLSGEDVPAEFDDPDCSSGRGGG